MSSNIRNFCIIAHIDHGKSTLADRLLELTNTIPKNKMKEQVLDRMDLERERGITIKMQPVRMIYHTEIRNPNIEIRNSLKIKNLKLEIEDSRFILNLIDTPGHMDFGYEVERSLAAVEGAILLIDATKGVQAQTLANLRLARAQNLTIIPVLNKMDMPAAQINEAKIKQEIKQLLNIDPEEILSVSAKQGTGVGAVLERIIRDVPPPEILENKPLKALVFDSAYDSYKGIIAYVRIFEGSLKKAGKIKLFNVGKGTETIELGYFSPDFSPQEEIRTGEIGYIATGLKDSRLVKVGETITSLENGTQNPVAGYHEPEPLVFANVFPSEMKSFPQLTDSLSKLHLNDASFYYEPTNHAILGRGFNVGFLGMLHLEIVFERLKREYGTKIILTSPTVIYKIVNRNGKEIEIYSAQEMPDPNEIQEIKEPWVEIEIITPTQYSSKIHEILKNARGIFKDTEVLSGEDIILRYDAPLSEIIEDFLDNLKSVSQGYASFSYKVLDYKTVDLVKLDFAIVGEVKPSLSKLVEKNKSYRFARDFLLRLKENLPGQQFSQAIQAKIGGKIIAREDIKAMRKDVTAPLYGGDYTRKKKLLQKQKKGKKRLLENASVRIPEEVYLKILKRK
ncbi:MAG: translation elongation factor 4 [Candidatus Paceibacterota bacterium]|jgi:GTP-binding protein LepA